MICSMLAAFRHRMPVAGLMSLDDCSCRHADCCCCELCALLYAMLPPPPYRYDVFFVIDAAIPLVAMMLPLAICHRRDTWLDGHAAY